MEFTDFIRNIGSKAIKFGADQLSNPESPGSKLINKLIDNIGAPNRSFDDSQHGGAPLNKAVLKYGTFGKRADQPQQYNANAVRSPSKGYSSIPAGSGTAPWSNPDYYFAKNKVTPKPRIFIDSHKTYNVPEPENKDPMYYKGYIPRDKKKEKNNKVSIPEKYLRNPEKLLRTPPEELSKQQNRERMAIVASYRKDNGGKPKGKGKAKKGNRKQKPTGNRYKDNYLNN